MGARSRAAPLSPKYFAEAASVAVASSVCSMCTCTSMATSPAASMRFASVMGAFVGDDDARRNRLRVELLDERSAVAQHGALVDRSLVGDLSRVDRWGLVEHERPGNPRRAPGRRRTDVAEATGENPAEIVAAQRVAHPAIREDQRRHLVAVVSGDDHVLGIRRERREELYPQWTHAHPGAGRKLEVLVEPAVEREPLRRVGGIDPHQGVAEPVVALLVECRARARRIAPEARRDARSTQPRLELVADGDE